MFYSKSITATHLFILRPQIFDKIFCIGIMFDTLCGFIMNIYLQIVILEEVWYVWFDSGTYKYILEHKMCNLEHKVDLSWTESFIIDRFPSIRSKLLLKYFRVFDWSFSSSLRKLFNFVCFAVWLSVSVEIVWVELLEMWVIRKLVDWFQIHFMADKEMFS